ncbi:MAG: RNA polymerase sigma factor [Ktedonobacterales bacterium]
MEENLIVSAQHGDAAAFETIVKRYTDVAWRVARILLPNRQTAEDALQEAWLDAWRGLSRYSTKRPFRPWLLAVVANRCRMVYRQRSLPTVALLPEHAESISALTNVEAAVLESEQDSELLAALAVLSNEQRRVLELRFFADLELEEIALVMHSPLGTVKSRLSRALAAIRADISSTGSRSPKLTQGWTCHPWRWVPASSPPVSREACASRQSRRLAPSVYTVRATPGQFD